MELTVGFISLFLMLVLPGIIFRRYYFQGEFSKQVSVSQPLLSTLVYSLIPGVIIQMICLIGYDTFVDKVDGDFLNIFELLVWNGDKSFEERKLTLSLLIQSNFFFYSLGVYLFAMFTGYLSFLLVRYFGLDRKVKILRFKNSWAYVFSGEIMQFQKFRNNELASSNTQNGKFLFPHIDVLVKGGSGETNLYTGYLKDYELSYGELNNLDHIYLMEAKRYNRGIEATNLVPIPGDFLIIRGSEILNINVRYIYAKEKEAKENLEELKLKRGSFWFRVLQVYNVFLIISILSLFIPIFVKLDFLGGDLYDGFVSKPWYKKLLFLFAINFLYGMLFPFKKDSDNEGFVFKGWIVWISTLVVMVIFLFIFYLWAY